MGNDMIVKMNELKLYVPICINFKIISNRKASYKKHIRHIN